MDQVVSRGRDIDGVGQALFGLGRGEVSWRHQQVDSPCMVESGQATAHEGRRANNDPGKRTGKGHRRGGQVSITAPQDLEERLN